METAVFYDLLNTPQKADLLSDELQKLVEDYPWFVHGQMLFSKSLQLLNDSNFDEQLHKTSVYTPDREILYNLITIPAVSTENETSIASPFSIDAKGITTVDSKTETKITPQESWKQLKEEKIKFRLLDNEAKKKEETGGENSSILKIVTVDDDLEKSEVNSENISPVSLEEKHESQRVFDTLEKNIITDAVSRVIEKEVEEQLPEPVSVEEPVTVGNPKLEPEEVIEYSSYTSLILKRAKELQYIKNDDVADFKKNDTLETLGSFDHKEKSLKEKKKKLLDRFIALSPKITRGKLDDYEPVNLGEESLKESDFFITETMARIYAQQGKIGKAKKTYQLLSLKYPEKSVYFAAQIKNLDKK